MVIGDPYKFAIFVDIVEKWNIDYSFNNGILFFSIDGELFPDDIRNATLNYEIGEIEKVLNNILKVPNKDIFNMEKKKALVELYNITFPEDGYNDYQYYISSTIMSDANCEIFIVTDGETIRILASKLNYNIKEGKHNIDSADIVEVFILYDEFNEIIFKLSECYKTLSSLRDQNSFWCNKITMIEIFTNSDIFPTIDALKWTHVDDSKIIIHVYGGKHVKKCH